LAIYQQALATAQTAERQIKQSGQTFWRPSDYFAEMLKTDKHMLKIKKKFLDEKQAIQNSEEARKQRDLKKFGKKIQVQKMLDRQKQKTDMLQKITDLKKKRKANTSGGAGGMMGDDDEFDIALDESNNDHSGKKKQVSGGKRTRKDTKFGFGGKKRFKKSNTSESTNDFDFSAKNNKRPFTGQGGKSSGKKSSKQQRRPGKSRRTGKSKK
jgi:rRNA-processing protein EBP2